jgi:hypothetical protein
MSQKRFLLYAAVGVLLAAAIPYLIAFQAGEGQQFGGFLINPVDGHSYLAKMQEGYRGDWKFTLPYTAETGQGAYLFLFYLSLGHLAKLLQAPLIAVFHIARLLGGAALIWAIAQLAIAVFKEEWTRKVAFLLILLGSGLGWIAVLSGMFSSDFWVAEAFPFLSLYTNPHFSLGLALMIMAILPVKKGSFPAKALLGLAVAVIQPFGVVIIGLVLLGDTLAWMILEKPAWGEIIRSEKVQGLAGFGGGGAPVLIYQYWAILRDPVLAAWHTQNQTPTPSPIDLLVSFSPALIVGLFGLKQAWQNPSARKLVVWAAVSIFLVFIPWNLQRRFLTGIYVPLAALAVFGLEWLAEHGPMDRKFWTAAIFVLSLPTNIIVVLSGLQAVTTRDPQIYIDPAVGSSLEWIDNNTEEKALIIAEPDLGLLIPSATGRRVIYGHPFETISAESELIFLDHFYYQPHSPDYYRDALVDRWADYVVLTSDVNPGLRDWLGKNWDLVYAGSGQEIYSRQTR